MSKKPPMPKHKRPKRPLKKRPPKFPPRVRTVAINTYFVPFPAQNIVIVGQVVVRSPSRFTASDGDIQGAVKKAFHLDQSQPEVTAGPAFGFQVNVAIELTGRLIQVRWRTGGGTWSAWSDVAWW